MQLTGTKRLRDGRQMLPAGGYSEPTENQGIMDMETGEIIALSKKDQRIADAKKNRKEVMAKLQAKVDKENAEAAKPKDTRLAELKGTEKQVKWAEDIRGKVLKTIDRDISRIKSEYQRLKDDPDMSASDVSFAIGTMDLGGTSVLSTLKLAGVNKPLGEMKPENIVSLAENFQGSLVKANNAKYWIDNRTFAPSWLFKKYVEKTVKVQ